MFGYENRLVFQIFVSDKKSRDSIDLLLIVDGGKSHYVYIKNFDRFMFHKTKNKNKKYVCKSCLQCLSSKNVLAKHKEDCLSINDVQSTKVKKGTIEFENYFKQIPGPFMKTLTQKSIKNTFLAVLLTKLLVLMIDLISQLLF